METRPGAGAGTDKFHTKRSKYRDKGGLLAGIQVTLRSGLLLGFDDLVVGNILGRVPPVIIVKE